MQDGTSGGFFFNYCNNVLAHNVTMYYEFSQNPWYQATITGISANGQIWNITVSLLPLSMRKTPRPHPTQHGDRHAISIDRILSNGEGTKNTPATWYHRFLRAIGLMPSCPLMRMQGMPKSPHSCF